MDTCEQVCVALITVVPLEIDLSTGHKGLLIRIGTLIAIDTGNNIFMQILL